MMTLMLMDDALHFAKFIVCSGGECVACAPRTTHEAETKNGKKYRISRRNKNEHFNMR